MELIPDMDLNALTDEDKRSWHLNAAAIVHACADWPAAVLIIARNLDRMDRDLRVAPGQVERCRDLLRQGPDAMKAVFLALDDEGQLLRSIHPWAGLLPNAERVAILRATGRPPEPRSS